MRLVVSDVRFVAAPPESRKGGLLGWTSLVLDQTLRLEGLAVRRTLDGRLTISFPTRRDHWGRHHFVVRPLDNRTRLEIESQVFAHLGVAEGRR